MQLQNLTDRDVTDKRNADMLVLTGGTIIDGNEGPPVADGVILIEGARIKAVGDLSISVPPHAERIEVGGKFIIPGLLDPHVCLVAGFWPADLIRCEGRYDEVAIEAAQLALKGGVTTVFDFLGPRDALMKARDAVREGRVTAARIYLGGHLIGLAGPFSPDLTDHGDVDVGEDSAERKMATVLSSVDKSFKARVNALWEVNVGESLTRVSLEEARKQVREHIQSGIDFVTYLVNAHRLGAYQYIAFSQRVQQMIVEEAHRAGLPAKAFFASTEEGVNSALDAGVDILAPSSWEGGGLSARTLALIAQRKTSIYISASLDQDLEWYRRQPANALYPGLVNQMVTAELDHRGLIRSGAQVISAGASAMHGEEPLRLIDAGTAPGSNPEFGEGHIRGLQALQQKGMTAMEAMMAATRNVARAYKVDRDLGTLERGKLADLVILNKNPLENPQNYRDIYMVMKEGQIIEREALPTQRLWSAPAVESR
jgi:imidazolonepropionase-like amidohydrolase